MVDEDDSRSRPASSGGGSRDADVWDRLASEQAGDPSPPSQAPPDDPSEGVRIIGAQTAADASGAHEVLSDADVESDPDDAGWEAVSYPDAGPSWSATDEPEDPDDAPAAAPPPGDLPHWSEPPTAEMAAVGTVPEDSADDSWGTFGEGEPRFRSEESDWAEADFGEPEPEPAPSAPPRGSDELLGPAPARRRGASRRTAATSPPARPPEPGPHDASGRDLPTAVATAGIIAVLALLAFSVGTFATALLASVIIGAATLEFATGLRAGGFRPAVPIALLASLTLPLAAHEYGISAMAVYAVLVVVFSLLWFLWRVTPGRPIGGISSTTFAFFYVGFLGGFAGLLLQSDDGIGLLLGAVICTIAYDVAGFFFGSQFGRTPVAPAVSPNKTVEGTIAGMLASVAFGWLVVGQIHPWNGSRGLLLGVLIALGAFLGDLSESLLKRDLGIKDFGSVLPGHGGVLDRFDGLLVALPITYYVAVHFDILF